MTNGNYSESQLQQAYEEAREAYIEREMSQESILVTNMLKVGEQTT
jgi:hypothetical protein